jgi:PAS domain S-box-containing protein
MAASTDPRVLPGPSSGSGRRETILVVEDDPGVARLESLHLRRAGYEVVCAPTAEGARRVILGGGVDLIVLDQNLQGEISGLDFYEQLRAEGLDLPAILVTGLSDEDTLVRAIRVGLRDFVPKLPDYFDDLTRAVERVFKQVRTEWRLAESEARLAGVTLLAEAIPQIVWTARDDGRIDYFNGRWIEHTGLSPADSLGGEWSRAIHPEDRDPCIGRWAASVASGEIFECEYRLMGADGAHRWFLGRAELVREESGRIIKWFGTCTDIDDQKRAEGMLAFLAEVSSILASSLEDAATVARVLEMAVPQVADSCLIDVVQADGATRRLAVATGAGPAEGPSAWKVFHPEPPPAPGAARAFRPELIAEMALHAADPAREPEHLALLRAQGATSAILVPLAAHGRSLGFLSFAMTGSGRRYGPGDLALIEDMARRVAMAVENARLFREARQARLEAEAANRAKDRFLAVLSHELRTPLTPVLAEVSAMIADPATPAPFRPFLEMTHRNVELEARLIDDLLDLNRIGRGKLRLARKVVDIHRAIRQALEICRPGIRSAGLTLEVDLGASQHHAAVDPARFQQVIWNLI